jgi:S1-C subfamily serine protease
MLLRSQTAKTPRHLPSRQMQKIVISKTEVTDKIVVSGSEVTAEDRATPAAPPLVPSSTEPTPEQRPWSLFWWAPLIPVICLFWVLTGRGWNCLPWFNTRYRRRHALWILLLAALFWGASGFFVVETWYYRQQAMKSEHLAEADRQPARAPTQSNPMAPEKTANESLPQNQSPSSSTSSLKDLFSAHKNRVFIIQQHNGQGSGVMLYADREGKLIATARHVVERQDARGTRSVETEVSVSPFAGSMLRAQVVGWHLNQDLALVWLPGNNERTGFRQPILESGRIEIAEPVWTIGHPLGQTFSLSDGKTTRLPHGGLLQFNAPVSSGNSGGPLYDLKGNLLGIVSFVRGAGRGDVAQNLNFAVCADAFLSTRGWQINALGAAKLEAFSNDRPRRRGVARQGRPNQLPLNNQLITYAKH